MLPKLTPWLTTETGRRFLEAKVSEISPLFLQQVLPRHLERGKTALSRSDAPQFRMESSLNDLCQGLATLCLADHLGLRVPDPVWSVAGEEVLPRIFSLGDLTFQGRTEEPRPWRSDLRTSELGVLLAWIHALDQGRRLGSIPLKSYVLDTCLTPITREWLDHQTRLHSLDSMGHNWWSVLVGGAGVIAALLEDWETADQVADALECWSRYPGNPLWRKQRNFGREGDFVESFAYAEFALLYPVILSHLSPSLQLVPNLLDEWQARGLAKWLRNSFLPTRVGWSRQRIGDIQLHSAPQAAVWQALLPWNPDPEMQAILRQLRPEPANFLDIPFWREHPQASPHPTPPSTSLEVFPTSGLAFLRSAHVRLTVRAGEFWNHNHLDAGSFLFHDQGVTWVDDAGSCDYARREYTEYYVSAPAHNVAFAPRCAAPSSRAFYEGTPHPARFLMQEHTDNLSVLCADTGILSGGALARSHRWFLGLNDHAVLVWDDLQAYRRESFACHLHTPAEVQTDEQGGIVLRQGELRCPISLYADVPCEQKIEPVPMGQTSGKGEAFPSDFIGNEIIRQTSPALRAKFGMVIGCGMEHTEWRTPDEAPGWECRVRTPGGAWRIWWNGLADGRLMHRNSLNTWIGIETDAVALVLREEGLLHAISASLVRHKGTLLHGGLSRRPLITIRDIPPEITEISSHPS